MSTGPQSVSGVSVDMCSNSEVIMSGDIDDESEGLLHVSLDLF